MLDVALKFLADELNSYLQARTGVLTPIAKPSAIVKEDGKYAIDQDRLAINIVNIEEEATTREQLPVTMIREGQNVVLEPPLKLNLFLLFAAHFQHYDEAIKYLSHVLAFFQARRVFVRERYPALAPGIERLVVELQRQDYEALNQVWAYIGGKHLPSVTYRVRMVQVQDDTQTEVGPPILEVDSRLGRVE